LAFLVKKVSKIIRGKIQRSITDFLTKRALMQIGSARISTQYQNLDLQKDALKRAGCEKIELDVASGKSSDNSHLISYPGSQFHYLQHADIRPRNSAESTGEHHKRFR
jgi:hypothetical protein